MTAHLLLDTARRRPGHLALDVGDRAWTYAEIAAWSLATAGRLEALGIGAGDRVALLAANSAEWVVVAQAVRLRGAALVPLNVRLTPSELEAQLALVSPRLTVVDGTRSGRGAIGGGREIALEALTAPHDSCADPRPFEASRLQTLMFTSGTTGNPKAAMLTGGNHLANAHASTAMLTLCESDRWVLGMPLFHVGGLCVLDRAALVGAGVLLQEAFEPDAVLHACRRGGSVLSVVPTMLRRLRERLGEAPWPPALRAMLVGGAPIPPDQVASCAMALPTYGLTEACSHATLVAPGASAADRRTAGRAIPGLQLRVLLPDGREAPVGEPGAIAVKGPTVFAGYWQDEAATRSALQDGWLLTGDEGCLDAEGRLMVLARRTDLIVSGGENLYPAEIEAAIAAHPAIAEVAVFGVPDARWGQVPLAALVSRAEPPSERELRTFLAERLARFKHPRDWVYLDELPRLASGKIDRRALRRIVNAEP